jgi:hypothetical protein
MMPFRPKVSLINHTVVILYSDLTMYVSFHQGSLRRHGHILLISRPNHALFLVFDPSEVYKRSSVFGGIASRHYLRQLLSRTISIQDTSWTTMITQPAHPSTVPGCHKELASLLGAASRKSRASPLLNSSATSQRGELLLQNKLVG